MSTWLRKWMPKDTRGTATHLLLNGGKLVVLDTQHGLFLNEYANAVARGEKLFVVETRTPIFRLFVDFDFKPPPSSDVIDAALQSASRVAGYYFDATSDAVILRKDRDTIEKIGVHVVWESIYVTTVLANTFRSHLVSKLTAACPDVDWNEVVDASVYAGSGLRLPWSSKTDASGVYAPTATCSPDGTLDPIQEIKTATEIRTWIRRTTIRAPDEQPTRSCVVTSDDGAPEIQDGNVHAGPRENLTQHTDLLARIHATLPPAFTGQKFTGMHRFGDFCVVLRSSSKVCGNKDFREHTKNTIYFVVLKKGYAYQRCYCRKDVVRDGGVTCTDYTSDPWAVPPDIVESLWPTPKPATAMMMDLLSKTRPKLKKRQTKRV